jgi:hypothetical protein
MAKAGKLFIAAVALVAARHLLQPTFVPAPAGRAMPMATAAGASAMLGAAPAVADKIDEAAATLSSASYAFLKDIDWNADYYKMLPSVSNIKALDAVAASLNMGAAMDSKALNAGVLAHIKAIGSVDEKGVTSLADYSAINAAIGHMIASVPASKTLDVYGAFQGLVSEDVMKYLVTTVNGASTSKYPADAQLAYQAFMDFKDVVKASQPAAAR